MSKCRKCRVTDVGGRKYGEACKATKYKTCRQCEKRFRTYKDHEWCSNCRTAYGKNGTCVVCNEERFIYAQGCCTTCYRFLSKYSITVDELLELRKVDKCQLCGIEVSHHAGNGHGRAIIDHNHTTGKVRGVLCNNCNCIEGYIRDEEHLKKFIKNFSSYMQE
jgi:hypothetical protein